LTFPISFMKYSTHPASILWNKIINQ
jgi:hypothetical protein